MGCTSSTPNMVTPKSNTAEKSIQFQGDTSDGDSNDVEEIIYRAENNDKNEINVLPSCDTLSERIHVVRNKSTPSLQSEKGHETTEHADEKVPKLEEVVEKVVELHKENVDDIFHQHDEETKSEGKSEHDKETPNDSNVKDLPAHNPSESAEEQRVEHPTEAMSPSHSESSRATRWEALADIAAELPASHAVDPMTGQIYALSK